MARPAVYPVAAVEAVSLIYNGSVAPTRPDLPEGSARKIDEELKKNGKARHHVGLALLQLPWCTASGGYAFKEDRHRLLA